MKTRQKIHPPVTEMLKSIPETFGIRLNEEPVFDVLKEDEPFQIRRYYRQLLAKVTLQGLAYDEFKEKAFSQLSAYIFGENFDQTKLPMTSPVLIKQEDATTWTMFFVLPSHLDLTTAPKPLDSAIRLKIMEPQNVAIVGYSGDHSLEKTKQFEVKLMRWLKHQREYQANGKFCSAQYDAPFVISFLKKNEVQIRVTRVQ